jgi:hypothetical protein
VRRATIFFLPTKPLLPASDPYPSSQISNGKEKKLKTNTGLTAGRAHPQLCHGGKQTQLVINLAANISIIIQIGQGNIAIVTQEILGLA